MSGKKFKAPEDLEVDEILERDRALREGRPEPKFPPTGGPPTRETCIDPAYRDRLPGPRRGRTD